MLLYSPNYRSSRFGVTSIGGHLVAATVIVQAAYLQSNRWFSGQSYDPALL